MRMAVFPIVGIFREPLLILEATVILFGLEFGLVFLYRFLKEKKERSMLMAWSIFLLCFSAMVALFMVSDFFITPPDRRLYLNCGYAIMGIGILFFTFSTERELQLRNHPLSLILVVSLGILVIDFFVPFVNPIYIVYICWIPMIFTLFYYIVKVMKRIKEYRTNIIGFFGGFLIYGLGFAATIDVLLEAFGPLPRLLGNVLMILGVSLISFMFLGMPSMKQIEWVKKINKLLILHSSGTCICDYDFGEVKLGSEREEGPVQLLGGWLMGFTQLIQELVHSKEEVKVLDHHDKKVILAYGDHLIAALVADEHLEIYKRKLNGLVESLEMIYKGLLDDWKGSLAKTELIGKLIRNYFS
jgi:hypothetical protein